MIRTLVAEDMHLIRGALVALLGAEADIDVVAEVDRGDEIVPTALRAQPDVAVIDIYLPGMNGLDAAGALYDRLPGCDTLILTAVGTPGTLRRAMAAHVRGFLPKDVPPGKLADGIRRIRRGQRIIDPDLAVAALEVDDNPLTAREQDVLGVAAEGAPVAEIAHRLFLSDGTVRNYLSKIVTKVGARNRVDAIRRAKDAGWL